MTEAWQCSLQTHCHEDGQESSEAYLSFLTKSAVGGGVLTHLRALIYIANRPMLSGSVATWQRWRQPYICCRGLLVHRPERVVWVMARTYGKRPREEDGMIEPNVDIPLTFTRAGTWQAPRDRHHKDFEYYASPKDVCLILRMVRDPVSMIPLMKKAVELQNDYSPLPIYAAYYCDVILQEETHEDLILFLALHLFNECRFFQVAIASQCNPTRLRHFTDFAMYAQYLCCASLYDERTAATILHKVMDYVRWAVFTNAYLCMEHARELYSITVHGVNRVTDSMPFFLPEKVQCISPPSYHNRAFPHNRQTIYSSSTPIRTTTHCPPVCQDTLETFIVTRALQVGVRAPHIQRRLRSSKPRTAKPVVCLKTPAEVREKTIEQHSPEVQRWLSDIYPKHTWIPSSGDLSLLPPAPPVVFDAISVLDAPL